MKRVSLRTTAARTERQTKQTSTTTPTTSTRTSRPRQAKTQAAGSSTTLDLQSVKRDNTVPVRKKARIFGLTEAPIYYPTADEFKDPLHYIEKIRPEAEQYGIIKIVPPDTYKPPFSLNTEVFRFKTRIQKLNSMEGGTRANVNYLEQVQKFHRLFGQPLNRIPQLDKRPIDLYNLKKQVEMRGGVDMVNRHKQWAEIGRVLGYNRRECTSLSNGLKTAYTRVIQPYEEWLRQTKPKTVLAENANRTDGAYPPPHDKVMCEVCRRDSDQEHLLECDDCERGYHMGCLDPPLSVPPKGEWYCYKCLVASGNDYGFEDGGEYNLAEFQRVCEDFKVKWFSQYNPVEHAIDVSEEDCENEFWRLTENPHIDCEVEYGADLHSTQHGSAFPSIERDDNKAVDPWNLNMIPILPQSLFTHIKSDISGMMVPWLYVGMCFSAFCWHNEDHFTYSINYMHWGETKTWYGIPGDDTDKFEQTMRDAVPELFEQQPNLLFQLVTMLSPGTLLKNDVRCYAVDQRPGEFVVTFPKAYHSGFNHGFNFCEAVNFAPPDWVNMGLECVQRYKEYKRHPCFSHDELLVNTYKMELTPENATWLRHALEVMVHRELNDRAAFFKKHPAAKQARQDVQGEHQCAVCHCYTYLSMVTCQCSTKKVTCFQHAMEHCSCAARNKTVIMRFTDAELRQMVTQAMQA
ncbi:JmjC domain, hydroxylase-domain-containing protein, partial [Gongronella butleri]